MHRNRVLLMPSLMWASVLCLFFLGLVASAQAQDFAEGIDYERLDSELRTVSSDQAIRVTELFWYGCPHCNQVQGPLHKWLDTQADDIRFESVPAVYSRGWEPHARAYYAAELLGFLDESHAETFNAIHAEGRNLASEAALSRFYSRMFDVEEEEVRRVMGSFGVETKLRRAMTIVRRSGLEGVPAIIVAGRYTTSLVQNGSAERMFQVVDYLIEKERRARAE